MCVKTTIGKISVEDHSRVLCYHIKLKNPEYACL